MFTHFSEVVNSCMPACAFMNIRGWSLCVCVCVCLVAKGEDGIAYVVNHRHFSHKRTLLCVHNNLLSFLKFNVKFHVTFILSVQLTLMLSVLDA